MTKPKKLSANTRRLSILESELKQLAENTNERIMASKKVLSAYKRRLDDHEERIKKNREYLVAVDDHMDYLRDKCSMWWDRPLWRRLLGLKPKGW